MLIKRLPNKPAPYYQFRSEILHKGAYGAVSIFRCHPDEYTKFGVDGMVGWPMIVFPRSSVQITFEGQLPMIANPNVAIVYNRHQCFRRERISHEGDRCDLFVFTESTVCRALESHNYSLTSAETEQPFPWSQVLIPSTLYLLQRQIVDSLLTDGPVDSLFIDETMLSVLEAIVERALALYKAPTVSESMRRTSVRQREQRKLVLDVEAFLSETYWQRFSLEEISAEFSVSPYHLCRIFRKHTNLTLHQYREQLRLHNALEYLPTWQQNLDQLALALGFSNHSHFTAAFKRRFHTPPSRINTKRAISR